MLRSWSGWVYTQKTRDRCPTSHRNVKFYGHKHSWKMSWWLIKKYLVLLPQTGKMSRRLVRNIQSLCLVAGLNCGLWPGTHLAQPWHLNHPTLPPTWYLGHIHDIWTWYDMCGWNIDMIRATWTNLNIFTVCRNVGFYSGVRHAISDAVQGNAVCKSKSLVNWFIFVFVCFSLTISCSPSFCRKRSYQVHNKGKVCVHWLVRLLIW